MSSESPDQDAAVSARSFGPIKAKERIALLDVLRGFAILGILFVNNQVAIPYTTILFPSALDQVGEWSIRIFGWGKLWPLFAMLYGVGFAIQLERAQARGTNILPVYLRRQVFLALIGVVLLSVINVPQLLALAIQGVPMMIIGYLLRHRRPSWLLVVAALLVALQLGPQISQAFREDRGLSDRPEIVQEEGTLRIEDIRARFTAEADEAGSWNLDELGSRIRGTFLEVPTWIPTYTLVTLMSPRLLWYMLAGIFLWRIGVFLDPIRHRRFFLILLLGSVSIGLPATIYQNALWGSCQLAEFGLGSCLTSPPILGWIPLQFLGSLCMPLAYIAGVALLMQKRVWSRLLSVFTPVGRTALSNYALGALLPALIFGDYTPGLPKVTLGVGRTIGVLVFVASLQVLISRLWLRCCLFGPLEWLWRTLTYWKLQPMRLRQRG